MIVYVGLTPAVQRTLFFDTFTVGDVNRARATQTTASGKAVNGARVATLLGEPVRLVQILGGDSGRWIDQTLVRDGIAHTPLWADDDAPTRTCTTLLVSGSDGGGPTTELVEEAPPVEPHDIALLKAAVFTALLEATAVCLSGSLPPGAPPSLYAEIVREAHRIGVPVVVDAQKAPLALALAERPFLVKPNRDEAAATLGFPLSGDSEHDAETAVAALVDAGAVWALVSRGKAGALLGSATERYRLTPPEIEAVNPIGSGDSLAAGFLVARQRGATVGEAARYGTAVAAANCLTPTSGVVRPDDVARLLPHTHLERIR